MCAPRLKQCHEDGQPVRETHTPQRTHLTSSLLLGTEVISCEINFCLVFEWGQTQRSTSARGGHDPGQAYDPVGPLLPITSCKGWTGGYFLYSLLYISLITHGLKGASEPFSPRSTFHAVISSAKFALPQNHFLQTSRSSLPLAPGRITEGQSPHSLFCLCPSPARASTSLIPLGEPTSRSSVLLWAGQPLTAGPKAAWLCSVQPWLVRECHLLN